jgi:hypothetical protein
MAALLFLLHPLTAKLGRLLGGDRGNFAEDEGGDVATKAECYKFGEERIPAEQAQVDVGI